MSAIEQCFQALRDRQAKALIPFITAGDPDLQTTRRALEVLDAQGADLIELGIPYSDPLADGPVIQAAATRALQKGATLKAVLEMLHTVQVKAPLILFTYYNPIYQVGIPAFMQQIRAAGCSGLVVPDLPLEESAVVQQAAQAEGIDLILLIAPTSSPARMQAIAQQASGFIYLVSTTGVTGTRDTLALRVQELIQTVKPVSPLPMGVGFGISTPEQAHQVAQWGADAVIVGSAFVKRLAESPDPEIGLQEIGDFCQSLKAALQPQWHP